MDTALSFPHSYLVLLTSFLTEDHNIFWAETHGVSPAVLLLCSLLTMKQKWDWTLNVYYPHSSTPSRLFACLHVWEHVQKGVDLVSCKHFTDHIVLSYRLLVIQKQQIMKYQWDRQNEAEEESRRLFRFCSPSLVNCIKLDFYNWKAPQILWFFSLTDRVLQAVCEVQSSGIHMLWLHRKLSLPLKRKHGQSTALECSYETKPNKPGLFTTASSCIGHLTVKMLLCCYQQVFFPK